MNLYSCLAGFIEAGETPELTVHREIREEAGIEVKNLRYIRSQSWPFPSQLMLGFHAEYEAGELRPDPDEIDDIQWFSPDNLPPVPSARISVAGYLIQSFLEQTR
jgi:NAD+ diphosphatase